LGGIIGVFLLQLHRLAQWADSPFDTPVPEAKGAWGAAFSALYRRTRARQARQRDLATTIDRFRNAVEALPDGMVILDAANRIQWANRRALSHLGIELGTDTGRPLANFLRAPEFIRYLEAEDFADAVVVESQREAGATLSIQIVPFGVDERLLISRNITQVEAVSRMRRDFIANVSHELKTPLTVIAGFLETLQDVKVDARQRTRYLQLMSEQANSMQRLIDDLLTLSTLESEHTVRADTSFAVLPLLLECRRMRKRSPRATPHRPRLRDARDRHRQPRRARERVRQSREQRRALHAGRRHDHPRLARRRRGPRRVQRDGHRHRHRARAHSATDRALLPRRPQPVEGDGRTGLGLAIVKHVLIRHQAALDVTSEPDPARRSPCCCRRGGLRRSRCRTRAGARSRRLPVAERGAEERFQIVAPDILRRVADHPVLRLGARRERVEMRRFEPELREAVRHRGRAHQLDHASGEHFARIRRIAPRVSAPRHCAPCRCRSGHDGAVNRHTDGLLSTTAMPCGTSVLPSG
jgi:two-component system phosphate regulon sensor histidine kinase PhoR